MSRSRIDKPDVHDDRSNITLDPTDERAIETHVRRVVTVSAETARLLDLLKTVPL